MISHQNLEGCIPALAATLSTLALHDNHFSLFQTAQWKNDSSAIVLMHINLLTCSLPACGDVGANLSRPALSNRLIRLSLFFGLPRLFPSAIFLAFWGSSPRIWRVQLAPIEKPLFGGGCPCCLQEKARGNQDQWWHCIVRFGCDSVESCDANGSRNVKNTNPAKQRPVFISPNSPCW